MNHFTVTVRTSASRMTYTAVAPSSGSAYETAADLFGDTPCGITVVPAQVRA